MVLLYMLRVCSNQQQAAENPLYHYVGTRAAGGGEKASRFPVLETRDWSTVGPVPWLAGDVIRDPGVISRHPQETIVYRICMGYEESDSLVWAVMALLL